MKNIEKKRKNKYFFSWWIFAFLFLSIVGTVHAMKKKNQELEEIQARLTSLERERQIVWNEKEELLARIESQNDPNWIELILMKELGVVPEGTLKVHFAK